MRPKEYGVYARFPLGKIVEGFLTYNTASHDVLRPSHGVAVVAVLVK